MTGVFKPRNTDRARELRRQATPAERRLWTFLSKRQCSGLKFSRQMPVGPYIVDFLCREIRLVVEADGWSHDLSQAADAKRDHWLADQGMTVLRFSNQDNHQNVEGVLAEIAARAGHLWPTPNPSRKREGS